MSDVNLPISTYITRFFLEQKLISEYETPSPLPTLNQGEEIEIYEKKFKINKRNFAINEDAFFTIYGIKEVK